MRLIDVDKLIESMDDIYKEKVNNVPDNLAEGFMQMEKLIRQQPTAFDVGKVVEQLEKLRDKANLYVLKNMNKPMPCSGASNRAYAYDIAIEIVKAGEIDE